MSGKKRTNEQIKDTRTKAEKKADLLAARERAKKWYEAQQQEKDQKTRAKPKRVASKKTSTKKETSAEKRARVKEERLRARKWFEEQQRREQLLQMEAEAAAEETEGVVRERPNKIRRVVTGQAYKDQQPRNASTRTSGTTSTRTRRTKAVTSRQTEILQIVRNDRTTPSRDGVSVEAVTVVDRPMVGNCEQHADPAEVYIGRERTCDPHPTTKTEPTPYQHDISNVDSCDYFSADDDTDEEVKLVTGGKMVEDMTSPKRATQMALKKALLLVGCAGMVIAITGLMNNHSHSSHAGIITEPARLCFHNGNENASVAVTEIINSACDSVPRALWKPCPENSICSNGEIVVCNVFAKDHFRVENGNHCILKEESTRNIGALVNALRKHTIEDVCVRGGNPEATQRLRVENTVGGWSEAPLFNYSRLVNALEIDDEGELVALANLRSMNSRGYPEFLWVAGADDGDGQIGLHPSQQVLLPPRCVAKKLIQSSMTATVDFAIFLCFKPVWFIATVLFGLFVETPMHSLLFFGLLPAIFCYQKERKKRAALCETIAADRVLVRNAVYEFLKTREHKQPTAIIHVRDHILGSRCLNSVNHKKIWNEVWRKVHSDISRDNRVKKVMAKIDGEIRHCWRWSEYAG